MVKFSERYGYTRPNDVIIRERITKPILNAILNWLDVLNQMDHNVYVDIEVNLWVHYLNLRKSDFGSQYGRKKDVIATYICNVDIPWYEKLNMLERFYFYVKHKTSHWDVEYNDIIESLNSNFKRHNFAYRIVDTQVIEIASEGEVREIEEAIQNPLSSVKTHLSSALEKLSASQQKPDYRNSVKESISAVEALCREITNENTLGKALSKLEKSGVILNGEMKKGFDKLYHYTNDSDTGIRHALLDDENAPTADEAIFMLIACSAFINYLTKKNKH